MRSLSPALADHIEAGATTLCFVWTLRLVDGTVLGFTDHDRDIIWNGVRYVADTGMSGGSTDARLGFSTDSGVVQGVLSSTQISDADIDTGRLRDATLDMAVINWQDPHQSVKMTTGYIGEISRRGQQFTLEWLGQGTKLDRAQGRVFSRQCDAEFGDARCGLNAADFPDGTTCPRSFSACHQQFSNTRNFRGFPYLLGDDAMTAAPRENEPRDGGSRYVNPAL